jgi:DNA-binding PadR family transcriptional regulator
MMMNFLTRLDEEKGTLRLLDHLFYPGKDINRTNLIRLMEGDGVARTAFYPSLNCLKELGLVEDASGGSGRGKYARLTRRGVDVAEKVRGMASILANKKGPIWRPYTTG